MRFNPQIAEYASKPQQRCFEDFLRALSYALGRLGHELHRDGRPLVLGANDPNATPPREDAILYNAEPLKDRDPYALISDLYTDRVVWDYAKSNVELLNGLCKAVHCPVGYVEEMETIERVDEDIDVLFYGWVTPRRHKILQAFEGSGLNVVRLTDCYGEERDRHIARAKIVLNLHAREESAFEIFRCSHLFANRKCVVTESGGTDSELEQLAKNACSSYVSASASITDVCHFLLNAPNHRREYAERGYEEFKKIKLVDSVANAITASSL